MDLLDVRFLRYSDSSFNIRFAVACAPANPASQDRFLRKRPFLDSSMVEHAAVNRGVVGSSPTRGVWPGGQEVKTSPFHGGNTGSSPVRVTKYP